MPWCAHGAALSVSKEREKIRWWRLDNKILLKAIHFNNTFRICSVHLWAVQKTSKKTRPNLSFSIIIIIMIIFVSIAISFLYLFFDNNVLCCRCTLKQAIRLFWAKWLLLYERKLAATIVNLHERACVGKYWMENNSKRPGAALWCMDGLGFWKNSYFAFASRGDSDISYFHLH